MLFLFTAFAASPPIALRAGGGASVGPGVVGPSASLEAHVLHDRWMYGIRADAAHRLVFLERSSHAGASLEVGALTRPGTWRGQVTTNVGAAYHNYEDKPLCLPWVDTVCDDTVSFQRVTPVAGASLGVLTPKGNVWMGVRGTVGIPTVGVGLTVGPVLNNRS